MSEILYCQSCGMPLGDSEKFFGTNADGSINKDYCSYCYENGEFRLNVDMEQMIELSIPLVISSGVMNENEAREMMHETLPHLKRWHDDYEMKICY